MWSTPHGMYSMDQSPFDRDRRILSTISEHTENAESRPTSYAVGSRPVTQYSTHGGGEQVRRSTLALPSADTSAHIRSSTDPSARSQTPGRGVSNLIAQFEARTTSPFPQGHTRTASAPAGPRSPSPYAPAISFSQTMPATAVGLGFGASTSGLGSMMGYGSGLGYDSRSSSPTKGRIGSAVSGPRAPSSVSGSTDSRRTPGTYSRSQSEVSGYSGTPSRSATSTFTGLTGSVTPTETTTATPSATASLTLRRPQGSPRSPLTQVKNVVSAFKAKTPVLRKTQASSPAQSEGRNRRGRRSITPSVTGSSARGTPDPPDVSSGMIDITPRSIGIPGLNDIVPPPIDVSQLGEDGEVSCLFWMCRSSRMRSRVPSSLLA